MDAKQSLPARTRAWVVAFGLAFLWACPSLGATIRIDQIWDSRSGADDLLRTTSFLDGSGISSTGTSQVLLSYFGLSRELNGIGQFFLVGLFTDPPSLTIEGNTFAQFTDGLFDGIANVNLGGSTTVRLGDSTTGLPSSVGYRVGGSELILLFDPSGFANYDLRTTDVTVLADTMQIAEPRMTALSAILVLAGLTYRRRMRRKSPLFVSADYTAVPRCPA